MSPCATDLAAGSVAIDIELKDRPKAARRSFARYSTCCHVVSAWTRGSAFQAPLLETGALPSAFATWFSGPITWSYTALRWLLFGSPTFMAKRASRGVLRATVPQPRGRACSCCQGKGLFLLPGEGFIARR